MNDLRFLLAANLLLWAPSGFGYLDPASGSMLLSAVVALLSSIFFVAKGFSYRLINLLFELVGARAPLRFRDQLVLHSEGGLYWYTFKPLVDALAKRQVSMIYLTMDKDDPGLRYDTPYLSKRYIGSGRIAFAMLNLLEAQVCVTTTPGLDVLQMRRSRGVKHYVHLVHAPTDIGTYKLFSFDYFDTVMCSGDHQIKSLRLLEQARGTKPKQLLETGCVYMDALADLASQSEQEKPLVPRVLLAPTWGINNLLHMGMALIRPLIDSGFEVIIRPHPQSRISEPEVISELEDALASCDRVRFSHCKDGFLDLVHSDVMISSLSGAIFDYAFILEKPVVIVNQSPNLQGTEATSLPHNLWEVDVMREVGDIIEPTELDQIPEIIKRQLLEHDRIDKLRHLRAKSLFNYGKSGEIAARQLLSIADYPQCFSGK